MALDENGLNGWRTRPMYSVSRAAHLSGLRPYNIRRWLYGIDQQSQKMRPVFPDADRDKPNISFLQLVELVIAKHFRSKRISLERIRRAHSFAKSAFDTDYPFAHLKLKTFGVNILVEFQEQEPGPNLLSLDPGGQWVLPGVVAEEIGKVEFLNDLAVRWYPLGMTVPLVIDPRMAAGQPTIPNRGITAASVFKRWEAGQSIKFIADDFVLEPLTVENLVRYAQKVAV